MTSRLAWCAVTPGTNPVLINLHIAFIFHCVGNTELQGPLVIIIICLGQAGGIYLGEGRVYVVCVSMEC